jgi:hypothetical protein
MGADASLTGMFASYMIASVFRALGILPGGLGLFEAASVMTLHAIGCPPRSDRRDVIVTRCRLPGSAVANILRLV